MSLRLATLVSSFEESATLALSGRAKKMIEEGKNIVNFGVGEPDFNTPDLVIDAATAAARKGFTKYTAVPGLASTRKAVAQLLSKDYEVSYSADEVMLSAGGKQAIFHFLQSVIEPGDEVLILAPYWVSFPEMVKIVGGKPVIVQPSNGHRIQAGDLEKLMSPKTKAIILNSPSNPSGTVYSPDELTSFLSVLEKGNVWILSDDTYYHLVFEPARFSPLLRLKPKLRDRICVVGSASKSYAMTGWRIGWAVGPKPLIDAMTKIQSQVTSNPSSLSQKALEAAVTHSDEIVSGFRDIFRKRRDLALAELKTIPGLKWLEPDGAFYIFVNARPLLPEKASVSAFCERALNEVGVCVIPGEPFGDPDFFRLSYALSETSIKEGISRLKTAFGG